MKEKIDRALILAARHELRIRAARQSLSNFVLETTPGYQMGWVHREICDELDGFLQDIADKKSPRLIICMPPRSGKSEIVSRSFPAYAFGLYPDLQIIATSYSADLTQRFSRDVQRKIDDPKYAEIFPETSLNSKNVKTTSSGSFIRTAELFEIVGHKGAYRAAGVGGGITGMGADCLVIDDAIKDRRDANSATIREALWDWYTSTAYTRLSPGGGVIVMCTRWHMDDLVGRLLDRAASGEGEQWRVINYPAIAEHDEPHRKAGEALHPERYDLNALLRIQKQVGSRDWAALYQQHPVPDGGGLFKDDWIQHWDSTTLPKTFDATCISWDMTFKGSEHSDYVVGQVWGRKGANFYLLDQYRGQWDFVKTVEQFVACAEKWPRVLRKLVEEKANGAAVIATLKKHVSGLIPINPKESKEARAAAITPLWEAKNVFLPPAGLYPWVAKDFIPELLSFPAGAHDDQCFAAGTLVATPLGDRKIESIRVGDYVLTPLGYRRVLAAGQTGEAEIIEKFGISATKNHPFFVKAGGFKRFCLIKEEECSKLTVCQMITASRLLKSCSTTSNTGLYHAGATTSANPHQTRGGRAQKGFMLQFGRSSPDARFQKAGKFIIKTGIRSITISATLSAYLVVNTVKRSTSKLKTFAEILTEFARLPRLGTGVKKAVFGTKNTLNSQNERLNLRASVAEKGFWQRKKAPNSAPTHAKQGIRITATPCLKSAPASFAAQCSALSLGPIESPLLPVVGSADVSLESVGRKKHPVFNLMVEEAHCFYANGFLVHNCDAMTQALSDMSRGTVRKIHPNNLTALGLR